MLRTPPFLASHASAAALLGWARARAETLGATALVLAVRSGNGRAIRFYERNGFAHAGADVNPTSGRPVLKMEWKP